MAGHIVTPTNKETKMSKVKAQLLQRAIKSGNKKLAVQLALLNSVEGGNQVYLPNAYDLIETMMNKNEFAGYLSSLEREGFYKKQGDGFFGTIK
jgi:Mor family transcriptional regulator